MKLAVHKGLIPKSEEGASYEGSPEFMAANVLLAASGISYQLYHMWLGSDFGWLSSLVLFPFNIIEYFLEVAVTWM